MTFLLPGQSVKATCTTWIDLGGREVAVTISGSIYQGRNSTDDTTEVRDLVIKRVDNAHDISDYFTDQTIEALERELYDNYIKPNK